MRHDPYCNVHKHAHRMIPVECRHRIEVEIYPSSGQVYFADERFVDPACTQIRFDATVINAKTAGVQWSVNSADGGLASGTIDAQGLYRAPRFPAGYTDDVPLCLTEVITVRAMDDPARMAQAFVTVTGKGPLLPPRPVIRLSPRRSTIYRAGYSQGRENNEYVDKSNYSQSFVAELYNSEDPLLWKIDGAVIPLPSGADTRRFTFVPASFKDPKVHRIRAELSTDSTVFDEVEAVVTDYLWGGIWG